VLLGNLFPTSEWQCLLVRPCRAPDIPSPDSPRRIDAQDGSRIRIAAIWGDAWLGFQTVGTTEFSCLGRDTLFCGQMFRVASGIIAVRNAYEDFIGGRRFWRSVRAARASAAAIWCRFVRVAGPAALLFVPELRLWPVILDWAPLIPHLRRIFRWAARDGSSGEKSRLARIPDIVHRYN